MSKLPEGITRLMMPSNTTPDDFRSLITIGINDEGQIGIILSRSFGDACTAHDTLALEILAVVPKLVTDMAEQLLRKQ